MISSRFSSRTESLRAYAAEIAPKTDQGTARTYRKLLKLRKILKSATPVRCISIFGYRITIERQERAA